MGGGGGGGGGGRLLDKSNTNFVPQGGRLLDTRCLFESGRLLHHLQYTIRLFFKINANQITCIVSHSLTRRHGY